jgi:phospholipid/cholesterol/gamma-HCH transport system substrate-binding protein
MMARRYETIVGLFVVGSLAALLVMVLIIAQQEGLFEEYVEYEAHFRNVSGLKAGSEVHLAGVTVGNVKNVTINQEGNSTVTFQVVKKYSDRVREDSRASIGFQGLLGEKSLDLTVGAREKPAIPPKGLVVSVEPMDITQMLAGFGPSLENLQKVLSNLANITQELADPKSETSRTLDEVGEIVNKINTGKGTLGMLVNDPKLYKDTGQMMTAASKFMTDMEQGHGLLGALMSDKAFKAQVEDAVKEVRATFANLNKVTADLKASSVHLPEMAKKLDSFLTNLNRAGKGLPDLVTSGQTMLSDADKVVDAVQKTWPLSSKITNPKEHTIRLDGDARKE